MIPIVKTWKMTKTKTDHVFHPDFLGAHRYTTRGGTVRSAEGVLRTARASPFGRVLTQRQKERAVYGS